ncbi:unnamed protein product [Protopolystoma xenopodis]|uniref:Uncharacterized protein n=1 Tax=Protopolystoma xenopodis TaxID=117903 RepID=A0A448X1N2_9PLAT|nr:unnamed protein product [Protopolystoma xenopodis]
MLTRQLFLTVFNVDICSLDVEMSIVRMTDFFMRLKTLAPGRLQVSIILLHLRCIFSTGLVTTTLWSTLRQVPMAHYGRLLPEQMGMDETGRLQSS